MSAFLKNRPVKVLGGTFVYLSEVHFPRMTPYSPPPHPALTHYIRVYSILIHTGKGGGGGELTRENVRVPVLHKAGLKYQHDLLYLQSLNSIEHQ
jgi:hypothetical protein